jgi:hypothetical protein
MSSSPRSQSLRVLLALASLSLVLFGITLFGASARAMTGAEPQPIRFGWDPSYVDTLPWALFCGATGLAFVTTGLSRRIRRDAGVAWRACAGAAFVGAVGGLMSGDWRVAGFFVAMAVAIAWLRRVQADDQPFGATN